MKIDSMVLVADHSRQLHQRWGCPVVPPSCARAGEEQVWKFRGPGTRQSRMHLDAHQP